MPFRPHSEPGNLSPYRLRKSFWYSFSGRLFLPARPVRASSLSGSTSPTAVNRYQVWICGSVKVGVCEVLSSAQLSSSSPSRTPDSCQP